MLTLIFVLGVAAFVVLWRGKRTSFPQRTVSDHSRIPPLTTDEKTHWIEMFRDTEVGLGVETNEKYSNPCYDTRETRER